MGLNDVIMMLCLNMGDIWILRFYLIVGLMLLVQFMIPGVLPFADFTL